MILRIVMVAYIVYSFVGADSTFANGIGAGVMLGLLLSDLMDWHTKRHFAKKYGYRQKWVPIEDGRDE